MNSLTLKRSAYSPLSLSSLPSKRTRFTVNRSPFVYKKSREQFETHVRKGLLTVKGSGNPFDFLNSWSNHTQTFTSQYSFSVTGAINA